MLHLRSQLAKMAAAAEKTKPAVRSINTGPACAELKQKGRGQRDVGSNGSNNGDERAEDEKGVDCGNITVALNSKKNTAARAMKQQLFEGNEEEELSCGSPPNKEKHGGPDPKLAAKVVTDLARHPNPPSQLLLGKGVLTSYREKLNAVESSLNEWEEVTLSTEYAPTA